MKFAGPSRCMLKVFVFFVFHLVIRLFQKLLLNATQQFACNANEMPVHVILGFGLNDALGSHDLGSLRLAGHQGDFHGLN